MQITKKHLIKFVGLIIFILFAMWFSWHARENDLVLSFVAQYGYLGIFLFGIVSGFSLIFPIPLATFTPLFVEAGLNIWILVVVIACGMTIGDCVGYYLGSLGGKTFIHQNPSTIAAKLDKWKSKHKSLPYLLLFAYASFAPAANEVLVIPMGFLGYELKYILPAVFFGNIIFNALIAFGFLNAFELFFGAI